MVDPSSGPRNFSQPPTAFGKYTLFARLGTGGMADVFLAVARGPAGFNKLAVVKCLRDTKDRARVDMFFDEARLAARLNHPNVVDTYEVGDDRKKPFIAMEYLEGQALNVVLAKKVALGEPATAYVLSHVLRGLHYAHELRDYDGRELGVVHRDISPHNIFLTYTGEVKVLDFGIAKTIDSQSTQTGVLKGKVAYMAPEQIDDVDLDRRADVFVVGVVLWEMLAGRPLFEGTSFAILAQLGTGTIPDVRSVRPEASAELSAIAMRALERDPARRYPTAEAMRLDLEAYLRGLGDRVDDPVATLADRLGTAFAETRARVQERVNVFLKRVTSGELDTGALAATAAPIEADPFDLPTLDGSSSGGSTGGSGRLRRATSLGVVSTENEATRRRSRSVLLVGGAALLLGAAFVGVGILAPDHPQREVSDTKAAVAPPALARIHFETRPSGAKIAVDGRLLGATPATFEIASGRRTLLVTRDGFITTEVTLDVAPGALIDREIALAPLAEAPPAPSPASAVSTKEGDVAAKTAPKGRDARPAARPTGTATEPPEAAPSASASATAKPKIRVIDDMAP